MNEQDYKKIILKNGIRLILIPDKTKEVITSLVLFNVGSRYESEDEAGISHVLEHMFYKGSKKMPNALSVSKFIENIGGEHNAFTSKEFTGYYTKVASTYFFKSLDFLSDLITNPLFDGKELEKEKQVIIQEYDMYEDLPAEVASSRFELALFGKNSLGREVIGYKDSILKVSRDKLLDFRQKHYTGENTVIVLAGNFSGYSEKEMIDKLEESFGELSKGIKIRYPEIIFPEKGKTLEISKDTEQSHLMIGFRGANSKSLDRYRLKMLSLILGGAMSSRMFIEVREKRGLAYAIRTSSSSYLDTGMIDTYAGVPHSKVEEAKEAITGEFRKIRDKGITNEELERAKRIIFGRILISQEDTNEIASRYGLSELLSDRIITTKELIGLYNKMTENDINSIAKKYLKDAELTVCLVSKIAKK